MLHLLPFVVALLAPSPPVPASIAPAIPSGIAKEEYARLEGVVRELEAGHFLSAEGAVRALIPPETIRVYVDPAPVPVQWRDGLKHGIGAAIGAWNAALRGTSGFRAIADSERADVLVLFGPPADGGSASVRADEPSGHNSRMMRVWVALPRVGTLRYAAVTMLTDSVSRALGAYLGLPVDEVDGPRPTREEAGVATRLSAARGQLLALARGARPVKPYSAAFAVDRSTVDCGDVREGEPVRFAFNIENRGGARLDIDVKPACGCTVTTFERTLAPGARGHIEGAVHTTGFAGRIDKQLDVHTNDPANPAASLHVIATVRPGVHILPSDPSAVALADDAATTQVFEVNFSDPTPVTVASVQCDAVFGRAVCQPVNAGTGTSLRVVITFGNDAPAGRTSVMTTLRTSSRLRPQLILHSICEKGILVAPTAIYLGALAVDAQGEVSRVAFLSRRSGTFHVKSVVSPDPLLTAEADVVRAGAEYRLLVHYRGGWEPGMVQRELVVETDDPRQPRIVVPISASVLPRSPQ